MNVEVNFFIRYPTQPLLYLTFSSKILQKQPVPLQVMKLLLVEDHTELADNMTAYLARNGVSCKQVLTCDAAIDALVTAPYDVVVLDLMLPDGSGFEVLEYLKQERPETGVLIISARGALDDRLRGLEEGADDYLPKPFHLSELNARVKAIYRRRHLNGSPQIRFNEICIDPEKIEVLVHDQPLILTRKEYELLLFFLANQDRVLTKQAIAEHLWGDQLDLYDSFDFVYQHIKNLRKKISQAGGTDYLSTIYGFGYKFDTRKA